MKNALNFEKKIIPFGKISNLQLPISHNKKVLVGGCFDILHFGHLTFLKNAKQLGDILIIALESDEFMKNKKRKIPVHTQLERAYILAALEFTDLVILLPYFTSDEDYFHLTADIKPHIIAVTKGDPNLKQKKLQAKSVGANVIVAAPKLTQFASSKIVPYASFFGD